MTCDSCNAETGWDFRVRLHPDNPTTHTNWHIHYCLRCTLLHDGRELAKLMIGEPC